MLKDLRLNLPITNIAHRHKNTVLTLVQRDGEVRSTVQKSWLKN